MEISGFVGYTDAKYDSFPNPGGITLPIPGQELEDNEFAMLPESTASLNLRYTLPMGEAGQTVLQAGWYMQTEMAISDINDPNGVIDGYDLFNASIEWNDVMQKPLDLRLYARNLTDEEYAVGGISVWTTGFIVPSALYCRCSTVTARRPIAPLRSPIVSVALCRNRYHSPLNCTMPG